MSCLPLTYPELRHLTLPGHRRWVSDREDNIGVFKESLPPHFQYWRFPNPDHFEVSSGTLRINPSSVNLTALNGNYAGPEGQAFVGRKQQDTLFSFSVNIDFEPEVEGEEAGVSAFLTQNHHMDLGVVLLPAGSETVTVVSVEGTEGGEDGETEEGDNDGEPAAEGRLVPYFRFRAESYVPVPEPLVVPVPEEWAGETLRLEISGKNYTHYSFSAGPAARRHEARTFMEASNEALSWGFTGESTPGAPLTDAPSVIFVYGVDG